MRLSRALQCVSCLALCVYGKSPAAPEPPSSRKIVKEVNALAALPALINSSSLLAGIDPATLAAVFKNQVNAQNSQPNPIAHNFPNDTTGTINATTVILPIDLAIAQIIIPPKYGILTNSIKAVMPFFPVDKYPLVLTTQIDHDVQQEGIGIPDFTSVQFRFPFIDLLNDGYSTFSYIPTLYISSNPIAIAGANAYFEETIPATFNPPKDPYAFVPGTTDGEIFSDAYRIGNLEGPILNTTYKPYSGQYGDIGDYPLNFYTNVTNQPTFGCGNSPCLLTCDNQIRFFKTNVTVGRFAPRGIQGSVSLAPLAQSGVSFFPKGGNWAGVTGAIFDVAFIENNYKNCSDFKGYQYMGV